LLGYLGNPVWIKIPVGFNFYTYADISSDIDVLIIISYCDNLALFLTSIKYFAPSNFHCYYFILFETAVTYIPSFDPIYIAK